MSPLLFPRSNFAIMTSNTSQLESLLFLDMNNDALVRTWLFRTASMFLQTEDINHNFTPIFFYNTLV